MTMMATVVWDGSDFVRLPHLPELGRISPGRLSALEEACRCCCETYRIEVVSPARWLMPDRVGQHRVSSLGQGLPPQQGAVADKTGAMLP